MKNSVETLNDTRDLAVLKSFKVREKEILFDVDDLIKKQQKKRPTTYELLPKEAEDTVWDENYEECRKPLGRSTRQCREDVVPLYYNSLFAPLISAESRRLISTARDHGSGLSTRSS
ncbi:hypothetical protein BGX21_003953 [Mortierella sp. AD011]|nr:hypothetical protein BGX21_003953 [Mortierella sp. AD011]